MTTRALNWSVYLLNLLMWALLWAGGWLLPSLLVAAAIGGPLLFLAARDGRASLQLLLRRIIGVPAFLMLVFLIAVDVHGLLSAGALGQKLVLGAVLGFWVALITLIWRLLLYPPQPPLARRRFDSLVHNR